MDVFALLQTVAQVAVAFAGFGAIASGISSRSEEGRVDAGRLINMLITSLSVTILALVPCVLALFDMPEEWIWRGSAVVVLLSTVAFAPGALRRTRRMAKMAGYHRSATIANQGLLAASVLLNLLCAFGLPEDNVDLSFVAGLFALLTVSAILFFRMVFSLLREVRPD